MSTKKPAKGAAEAAPKNKQRITLVSKRERDAVAATSGMMDERLPTLAIQILAKAPVTVVQEVARAIGEYRFAQNYEDHKLTDSERRAQAKAAADTLTAAMDRISNLDPNLDAYLEEVWWRSPWNVEPKVTFGQTWREGAEVMLRRTVAMLRLVGEKIPNGKVGRKPSWNRDRFLERVANALREGGSKLQDAREQAVAIAEACGVDAPADERQQRRRMPGPKSPRKSE